jgi:hypothetical protein
VRNAASRWMDADPVPGTFVVNVGDMLARWTNNLFPPTLHRVINLDRPPPEALRRHPAVPGGVAQNWTRASPVSWSNTKLTKKNPKNRKLSTRTRFTQGRGLAVLGSLEFR